MDEIPDWEGFEDFDVGDELRDVHIGGPLTLALAAAGESLLKDAESGNKIVASPYSAGNLASQTFMDTALARTMAGNGRMLHEEFYAGVAFGIAFLRAAQMRGKKLQ